MAINTNLRTSSFFARVGKYYIKCILAEAITFHELHSVFVRVVLYARVEKSTRQTGNGSVTKCCSLELRLEIHPSSMKYSSTHGPVSGINEMMAV